jgi:hypothetical protein
MSPTIEHTQKTFSWMVRLWINLVPAVLIAAIATIAVISAIKDDSADSFSKLSAWGGLLIYVFCLCSSAMAIGIVSTIVWLVARCFVKNARIRSLLKPDVAIWMVFGSYACYVVLFIAVAVFL